MATPSHAQSGTGSGAALRSLAGLLAAFRAGELYAAPLERAAMERCAGELTARWDARFPGFPKVYFPYTSFRGEHFRGRRDAYLLEIATALLRQRADEAVVVNHACVFGRHARALAQALPASRVIAADIDIRWSNLYRLARLRRLPPNLSFVADDAFDSTLGVRPTAVLFFGACGAVADAVMDYAIGAGAPTLICRTCCHDNIGGNLEIARRATPLNLFFRFKNWCYGRLKGRPAFHGYYFSSRYAPAAYPRSAAARALTTAGELLEVARHSPESDICRTVLDLDRCLHLEESGYDVLYQGELFVAERRVAPAGAPGSGVPPP